MLTANLTPSITPTELNTIPPTLHMNMGMMNSLKSKTAPCPYSYGVSTETQTPIDLSTKPQRSRAVSSDYRATVRFKLFNS